MPTKNVNLSDKRARFIQESAPAKSRPELHLDARTFHIAQPGKRARHFFLYRIVNDELIDMRRMFHDSMDLKRHLPRGFENPE